MAQLVAMPERAARKLVETFDLLAHLPRAGTRFLEGIGPDNVFAKLVIIRPRRWSCRIIYELVGNEVVVHFIDPPWLQRTAWPDE